MNTTLLDITQENVVAPVAAAAAGRYKISPQQMQAIRQVDHFNKSEYRSLDLNTVLDFYTANFVDPLLRLIDLPRAVADIGTGYGWLALAFALHTNAKVVAMEYDAERLAAAQKIAAILGVSDKIEWIVGSISQVPLEDRAMDAVYCIEVIEHTGVDRSFVRELARVTNDVLVITAPNKTFPAIHHDTSLPFCHWLPLGARNVYATIFGRLSLQHNNYFWSPYTLLLALKDFNRVSRFLQFATYAEYCQAKANAAEQRTGLAEQLREGYFGLAAKLGRYSLFVLPNMASTFRRPARSKSRPAS